ncbi:MAG: FGGY family carbohydrate kinase [Victivallales bacterium]|nr:FGGY family carbohydrate kinase [Victivallales bacterium]
MAIYLGLDSSTQGLKAVLINPANSEIVGDYSVNFGKDLPQYQCPSGFLENPDPLVRHADPLLWLAALDLLFERMAAAKAPLAAVSGISGSGQQHGSVYLNRHFEDILSALDARKTLAAQLKPALSRMTSPIWMDRSTSKECAELNARFSTRIRLDTGSPATERFTGPQIRKFAKEEPAAYRNTAYIHLVSSFMASVLCGGNAPIDYGDGAGMNLLNLQTLQWDQEIAEFTAPGLIRRLPPVAASKTVAGGLSSYFSKYGLKSGIPVIVWSGDNPCSLVGMGAAAPGIAVISLGTSDTFFAAMSKFKTDPQGFGHVFGNPAGGFMSLSCFTNGSLARERVRTECSVSWEEFDVAAAAVSPGNNGNLMLPYFTAESTPLVLCPGVKYQGSREFCSGQAPVPVKIRAILESQALTMKLHSGWMGERFRNIRITGGASGCRAFRQILADVFQSRIEQISISGSAGLGAAVQAAGAVGKIPYQELSEKFSATVETVRPTPGNAAVYADALEKYAELEKA